MVLDRFFLLIYQLSVFDLILLGILGVICFSLVHRMCSGRRWWRFLLGAVLMAWTAVVLYATVLSRGGGSDVSLSLIPFHSYREVLNGGNPEILRSSFMNMVLFFPAGILSGVLLPAKWSRRKKVLAVLLIFSCFSLGIEYAQYALALGQAEMDDILHNTFGATAGCTGFLLAKKS